MRNWLPNLNLLISLTIFLIVAVRAIGLNADTAPTWEVVDIGVKKVDPGHLSEELIAAGLMGRIEGHRIVLDGKHLKVYAKANATPAQFQAVYDAHDGKDDTQRLIDQLEAADTNWATLNNAQKDLVLRRLVKVTVRLLRRAER